MSSSFNDPAGTLPSTADHSSASWTRLSAPTMGCPRNRSTPLLRLEQADHGLHQRVVVRPTLCCRPTARCPLGPSAPCTGSTDIARPWSPGCRIGLVRCRSGLWSNGVRGRTRPTLPRSDHPTQELPRKLPPTPAKESQSHAREERKFTRRCLWRLGSIPIERGREQTAQTDFVSTLLADARAANPFALPRNHRGADQVIE